MRERLEDRLCMTSELDVDDDGDDDDGNNIGVSDTVDGDEISATHSRKCTASCIRMCDREDEKDHSLKVQELGKVEKEVFGMGCLQRITVDDLIVVFVKERLEEQRIQILKRNIHIPSTGMTKT